MSELRTYGIPKKPVTLPQIFKGKQRESLIADLARKLVDLGGSALQHEGRAVAGIRSSLCLSGFSWAVSNHEAYALVGGALKLRGAVRPSYDEGQRDYTVPRENCKWCHLPINEENLKGQRNPYYCSVECAQFAFRYRFVDKVRGEHNAYFAAHRLIARQKQDSRECEHCRKVFKLDRNGSTLKYCSHACSAKARQVIPDRPCRGCGTVFKPRSSDLAGKYCSIECHRSTMEAKVFTRTCIECSGEFKAKTERAKFCCAAHNERYWKRSKPVTPKPPKERPRYERVCAHCGADFIGKNSMATLCSTRCRSASSRLNRQTRHDNVIPLTFEIFDSWFREAA
jgi:hypothetical protein